MYHSFFHSYTIDVLLMFCSLIHPYAYRIRIVSCPLFPCEQNAKGFEGTLRTK